MRHAHRVQFLEPVQKYIKWIDLAAGVLLAFLLMVTSPNSELVVPSLLFASLWLLFGWRSGLSLILIAVLLGVVTRFGVTRSILPDDLWLLVYGMMVWTVSLWIPVRFHWAGWGIGALWGALLGWEPGLWLLVLCALPQLAVMNTERERAVSWSASLVGGGSILWAILSGQAEGLFQRPGDSDTYSALLEMIGNLFAAESLLLVIGLVGLFELAQPMQERHTWSGRNLAFLGVPLTLLFVNPDRVLSAGLWIGFPAAAFLLTRWSLALPNLVTRVLMWIGLILCSGVLA